jgi:TIR domain
MAAAKVFLCYRRDDSAAFAGRVQDRLALEFGRDLLFMDVDAIPLGVNFASALRDAVARCEVLLAVIGPNWLDARDDTGTRRLDDPNDFVRIEIGAALQRNIPVIPILLDGARVPRRNQLPKELEELAMRNGLDVRHASFHNDIDRLIRGLKVQLADAGVENRLAGQHERRQNEKVQLAEAGRRTGDDSRPQEAEDRRRLGQTAAAVHALATPSKTPAMSRLTVQLSAAGLGLSAILQAVGIIGSPFGMGMTPTDIGTLSTVVPIIIGLIGATGAFGAVDALATPSGMPGISRPSVQLSAAGLGLSAILQAVGIIGSPFGMGMTPTDIGTLSTVVPIVIGGIGATGAFGRGDATMPSETPAMSRLSVRLGVVGLGLSAVLQALGIIGTPFGFGMTPTDIGTLATVVPIVIGGIGATGAFGTLATIGHRLFGGFARRTK